MRLTRSKLGLFAMALTFTVVCSACDDCDYPLIDKALDDANFHIVAVNLSGTQTIFFSSYTGAVFPSEIGAGKQIAPTNLFSGNNGDKFTFYFGTNVQGSASPSIKNPLAVTCTLNNATDVPLYPRQVKYDADTGDGHCENWGD